MNELLHTMGEEATPPMATAANALRGIGDAEQFVQAQGTLDRGIVEVVRIERGRTGHVVAEGLQI